MKTFNNFVESQTISGKLIEVATLMAENEMTPNIFLKTWFDENEPELSVYLAEAGVWDGIKQAGSAVWDGVKQGAQNYQRSVNGPDTHYQAAINSLNKLVSSIQNDPQLSANYGRLNNNINNILNDLKSNQGDVPFNRNGQWVSQNQRLNQTVPNNTAAPNQSPKQPFMPQFNSGQPQQNGNPPQPQQNVSNQSSFMPQYNNGTPQQNGNVQQNTQQVNSQSNLSNIANRYRKQYRNPKRNLGQFPATL